MQSQDILPENVFKRLETLLFPPYTASNNYTFNYTAIKKPLLLDSTTVTAWVIMGTHSGKKNLKHLPWTVQWLLMGVKGQVQFPASWRMSKERKVCCVLGRVELELSILFLACLYFCCRSVVEHRLCNTQVQSQPILGGAGKDSCVNPGYLQKIQDV